MQLASEKFAWTVPVLLFLLIVFVMGQEVKQHQLHVITNIREIRVHKGLSQRYLGNALGLSQHAYSKVEHGYNRITLPQLLIIADVLNVDVNVLLAKKKEDEAVSKS